MSREVHKCKPLSTGRVFEPTITHTFVPTPRGYMSDQHSSEKAHDQINSQLQVGSCTHYFISSCPCTHAPRSPPRPRPRPPRPPPRRPPPPPPRPPPPPPPAPPSSSPPPPPPPLPPPPPPPPRPCLPHWPALLSGLTPVALSAQVPVTPSLTPVNYPMELSERNIWLTRHGAV